ncbi:MAG: DUF4214 domain-containing protein [Pseudomonadota bacterium]
MESTFLVDAFFFDSVDNDQQLLFEGERQLRLVTDASGVFGGDGGNPLNDDLSFTLTDVESGEEIEVFDEFFARLIFTFEGETVDTTIGSFDTEDPELQDETDGFIVVIDGDPFPEFPVGTDLLSVITSSPNGEIIVTPPGFGANDLIPFTEFDGITVVDITPEPSPEPTPEPTPDPTPDPTPEPTGLDIEVVLDIAFLYGAAFDRIPDLEGVNFWIDRVDFGDLTFEEVAARFTVADEFVELYDGTAFEIDPRDYVELLYVNTLDRISDPSGFEFWVGRLEDEENPLAPEVLLIRFSESDEFRGNNPTIGSIMEVSPSEWEFAS